MVKKEKAEPEKEYKKYSASLPMDCANWVDARITDDTYSGFSHLCRSLIRHAMEADKQK